MTTSTKLATALFLIGFSTISHAQEAKEAWEIQAIGFQKQASVTVQVTRINDQMFLDPTSVLELGFPKGKIDTQRRYEISELGTLKIDKAKSSILLHVAPRFLKATKFDLGQSNFKVGDPSPALPEFVVNYEANATTENGGSAGLLLDGAFYLGGKYRIENRGILSASRNQGSQWSRIGSNITYEDPVKTYSWTLGDSISSNGSGVSPVSFTGFQYKKDYALQPGFVLQPVTELKGSASMPSVLEVYLDNRRILTNNIPAGPFSVANVVPQIGSNDARVIIRDPLGQERVITQSLLGGTGLLNPGLNNYAFQAGRLRTGSNEHQGAFASGFYSTGINNTFTVEVNGEASQKSAKLPAVRHVGISLFAATALGSFSARVRSGTGETVTLGYANGWRSGVRSARLSASTTRNSNDFRVLGSLTPPSKIANTLQGALQWAQDKTATIYMVKDDKSSNAGLSLTLSPSVQYKPTYSLAIESSEYSAKRSTAVTFTMSLPFNMGAAKRSQNVSTNLRYQDNSSLSKSVNFSNTTLEQTGVNFYAQADRSSGYERADATTTYTSDNGEQSLSVASLNGESDARGRMRGSLIIGSRGVNLNRWLTGGYARIESDIPNVDILVNGAKSGRTNNKGIGYVPILTSYTKTSLALDPDTADSADSAAVEVIARPLGGVAATFERVTGTLVSVAGVESGTLTVNGEVYPITDRGAYIELPEGSYEGELDSGRKIEFSIPKPGKALVQQVQIK